MAEYSLKSSSALSGYNHDFDGIKLRELTGLSILSIAVPLSGEAAAKTAIHTAFGIFMPEIGASTTSANLAMRLVRLGVDQLFLLGQSSDAKPAQLKGTVYTTDQSDVWIGLELSGPKARTALARICPIDLHPKVFAIDAAARTSMEHLGTIIIRTGNDAFVLLSASSSASSFLHAVELSIGNTS
ncbi:MAG: sarcosine oxidase subunit gamma [Rhodobacteraceae bacterium]|nr:sarcosine oxidase subunit gamma [Paracoccaceae bacterium]